MKSLLGLPFVLIVIALYFLPAIIAYMRKYKNRMSVLVIDLFLGWTLVGWVVALALSFADDVEENEKQDEMMENVLKIGGIIIGVLIILGIIGNLIKNVDTTSHSSSKQQAYYLNNDGNKDIANKNGTFLNKSPEEDNAVLLFQPDKLLELDEEERKEILSNLTAEDVKKAYEKKYFYINAKNKNGETALMYASRYCKYPEIIEILIKHGADVNTKNRDDKTALMYASRYNENPDIAETLIINGADLIECGKDYSSCINALEYAAGFNNSLEVIEMLIAKDSKEFHIKGAFKTACKYNENVEIVAALMKHINVDKSDLNMLVIDSVEHNNNPKVTEFLIDKGFNMKNKFRDGKTILMYASEENKNPEMVNMLMKKGAEIDAKDNNGKTALMYASERNINPEVVTALLQNKANINAADKDGKNALMIAYNEYLWRGGKRAEDVRKILIENGINPNTKDKEGKTTFMYVCENTKDINMIEKMLENGADINAKDKEGYSVYDYARRNKNILSSKIKAVLDKYQK